MQNALEDIGGNLKSGQVALSPRVWPPFAAVTYVRFQFTLFFLKTVLLICSDFRVDTSPVPGELLKDRIEQVWGFIQIDNGPLPPFLQIHVNGQD